MILKKMPKHGYVCYTLIGKKNKTYVGITNDMTHRLRQHNGEIKGGARATRVGGPWEIACFVRCHSKSQALSFEWYMHKWRNNRFRGGGLERRRKKLLTLLQLDKFLGLELSTPRDRIRLI